MFDNYVWCDEKVRNTVEVKGKVGFIINTLITYYRGIPLSMIDNFAIEVDGKAIEKEQILFCPNGEDWFTLNEMTTMPSYKWEYGVEGQIFVAYENGLAPGQHVIDLKQSVRVAYIPVPFGGEKKVTIII